MLSSYLLDTTLALRWISKNDLHIVGPAVVEQGDRSGIDRRAVYRAFTTPRQHRRVGLDTVIS